MLYSWALILLKKYNMILTFFLDSRRGGPHVYHESILKKFKLKSKTIFLDKKNFINFLNLKIFLKIFYFIDVIANSIIIYSKFNNKNFKIFFVYSIYNLSPILAGLFLKKKIIWFLIEEPSYFFKILLKIIPTNNLKFVVINDEIAKKLKIQKYRKYIPLFENKHKKKNKIIKKNIAISIGNLNRVKNHIFLVRALKNIKKDYKLLILGGRLLTQSNYYEILKNEIRKNDNINLLEKKKRYIVHKYLLSSKFFILPSISEGLSIALIEAINSNCVCLISKNSNSSKLIKDNYNGFIFNLKTISFQKSFKKALNLNKKKRELFSRRLKKSLGKLYESNNLSRDYLLN